MGTQSYSLFMSQKNRTSLFIIGLIVSFGAGVLFFFFLQKKTQQPPVTVSPIQGYPVRTQSTREAPSTYHVYDSFVAHQKDELHMVPAEEVPDLKPEDFELPRDEQAVPPPAPANPSAPVQEKAPLKKESERLKKEGLEPDQKMAQAVTQETEDQKQKDQKQKDQKILPKMPTQLQPPKETKPEPAELKPKRANLALQIGKFYSSMEDVHRVLRKLPGLPAGVRTSVQKNPTQCLYRIVIHGFSSPESMAAYRNKIAAK